MIISRICNSEFVYDTTKLIDIERDRNKKNIALSRSRIVSMCDSKPCDNCHTLKINIPQREA